jgi:hypothetical protein
VGGEEPNALEEAAVHASKGEEEGIKKKRRHARREEEEEV